MPVVYLADYPQHLPTVASWIFQQWGHRSPGNSLAETVARYGSYMQQDAIPLTLLSISDDGTPLGTASLWPQGMYIRPHLTPWLAAVYVAAEHRERGVGSELVRSAEEVARGLGIEHLYLFTPDRERFYARLGWQVLERLDYHSEAVVIMHKALHGANGEE